MKPTKNGGIKQKAPTKIHRAVVFIGLAAALVLCAFSCIALGRVRPHRARPSLVRPSIEELDAQAMPHFDEAERNVPSVVADLTGERRVFRWQINKLVPFKGKWKNTRS